MTTRENRVAWAVGACLLVAVWVAYGSALGFEFVDYDDPDYVSANRVVMRGLTGDGFVWAFTTGHASNWHPLTWLSHMLDVSLFGLDAAGHHATNVVLHSLNTLVVFGLLFRATGAVGRSAVVAALFGLHPLHVESVAWVAERKDVLSTFFLLLAIGAYANWARRGGAFRYASVAVLFALGLLSKSMLVTLPFVFLLLDYWPLARIDGKSWRARVVEKLPFFAMSAASSAVTYAVQASSGAVKDVEFIPFGSRLANAVISFSAYLGDAIAPVGLAVFYPHPSLPGGPGIAATAVVLSAVLLTGVTAGAIVAAKRFGKRYALAGWLFYLGTLVPVIGVVQVGHQARADRYTYVPLLGVFVAAVFLVADAAIRLRVPRRALAAAGTALALVLVFLSRAQAEHWRNALALFERALAVTDRNFTALFNLGAVLYAAGRVDEAFESYRQALAIHPGDPDSHTNIGAIYFERGDLEAARLHFEAAVRARPRHARTITSLAHVHESLGHRDEAIELLERAHALAPEVDVTRQSLLRNLGTRALALATARDAAARDGARALALATRGCELTLYRDAAFVDARAAALAELGRFDEAAQASARAVGLAEAAGATEDAALFRARVALYRAKRPLRE